MNSGEMFARGSDNESVESISLSSHSTRDLHDIKELKVPLMLCIFCICGPSKCIIVRSQHQLQMCTRCIDSDDSILVYICGAEMLIVISVAYLYTTSTSFLMLKGAYRQSLNSALHTNFSYVRIFDPDETNSNFHKTFQGVYKCYFLTLDEDNADFYDELERWGEKNIFTFLDNVDKEEVLLLKQLLCKYL